MSNKKLIIYDYDILFNILYEIKEYLNFEIIRANHTNISEVKKKIISDYLIISNKDNNTSGNFLIIDKMPIEIKKFLQILNIKFLKDKFNLQSNINIGHYCLNLNSREISRNDIKLDLTERETNLILFLKQSTDPVKVNVLQKEVWDYGSKLETHTVETHIYRLRKKISQKFNDDHFIESYKEGYKIN